MRETIASVKKELELSRQSHQETKNELRRHARNLDKIGESLKDALNPNPFNLNVIEDRHRPPWNVADVMAMASKVAERIRGLKEMLSITQSNHADLLDRFAPHKPDPRTTDANDGISGLGRR